MMTTRRATASAALAVLLSACASRQAAVPVVGTASEVEALVGEWVGEYSSTETGRSGSISFTLAASGDTAHGDVIMIPVGWGQPLRPWREESAAAARPLPEILTISFVRVTGNWVTGALAPYRDPECGCPLYTTFEGRLDGNAIEGTYHSRHGETDQIQRGRWSVTRVSRPPTR